MGRKELAKYIRGEKLTYKKALLAHCYYCMCGYMDGKRSCGIPHCPIYPFMPYREIEKV